jgi:hypothetical protein
MLRLRMKSPEKFRFKLGYLAAGLILPIFIAGAFLTALLLGAAWRVAVAPAARPAEIVRVCVAVSLTGSPRLATWWAPVFSGRAGLMRRAFLQSTTACGLARWQAWLPTAGALQTAN